MKFTVVWLPLAEREFVQIYTGAYDRAAVTAAANRLDAILGTDPHTVGHPYMLDLEPRDKTKFH
jgi:plasmid stabilization system protein ParE